MYKKRYSNYKKNYSNSYNRDNRDRSVNNNDRSDFKKGINSTHNHVLCPCSHDHSLKQELMCHLPIALIAFCLTFLGVVFFDTTLKMFTSVVHEFYHGLFHMAHYAHILFATAGSLIMFLRFSERSYIVGGFLSLISSVLFCTLSDIVMPTVSGKVIGFDIGIHLCLFDCTDLLNVIIFGCAGVITGLCLYNGEKERNSSIVRFIHTSHIVMSCIASFMYILAHTSIQWIDNAGMLLVTLVIAVVFPCILSDVIAPYIGGKIYQRKNNFYATDENSLT